MFIYRLFVKALKNMKAKFWRPILILLISLAPRLSSNETEAICVFDALDTARYSTELYIKNSRAICVYNG